MSEYDAETDEIEIEIDEDKEQTVEPPTYRNRLNETIETRKNLPNMQETRKQT